MNLGADSHTDLAQEEKVSTGLAKLSALYTHVRNKEKKSSAGNAKSPQQYKRLMCMLSGHMALNVFEEVKLAVLC